MRDLIGGFLSNDSLFGRIMTRIWIIFWANLMFALCTVPIVTLGAGFAALHYTMMKVLRGDRQLSVFKTFWKGLKDNFKQATISWLVILALAVFLYLDWYWCGRLGGFFLQFRMIFIVFAGILVVMGLYLYPTMAAFAATIGDLLKDSFYFAMKKPLYLIVILFFTVFPLYLTYTDPQYMPLYGFIWVTCGFALIVTLTDYLLLREFTPYLPKVNEYGEIVEDDDEEGLTDEEIEKRAEEKIEGKTDEEIKAERAAKKADAAGPEETEEKTDAAASAGTAEETGTARSAGAKK